jgi:predicted RNase H-like HicB family nuclease
MKRSFAATVWREGGWHIAQCLEVDIASQGESEEEALANLREALELHFEPPHATRPPQGRTIEVEVGAASRKPEIAVGTLRSILSQAHIHPDDWDNLH